jgi:hypothetical protein
MIKPIANNRFTQISNIALSRCKSDGGTIRSREDAQILMRQMVDLGLEKHLLIWMHDSAFKQRVSGSDSFVERVFDLSRNANDPHQSTAARQPKLDAQGFDFVRMVGNYLDCDPIPDGFTECSMSFWAKYSSMPPSGGQFHHLFIPVNQNDLGIAIQVFPNGIIRNAARSQTSDSLQTNISSTGTVEEDEWYYVVGNYNFTAKTMHLYVNNSIVASGTFSFGSNQFTLGNPNEFRIGMSSFITTARYLDGVINDLRFMTKELDQDQREKIFDKTKERYL